MNPNSRLRYEREQRGWSQGRVAELVGTDAGNVSRWERGFSSPSPYYREKLCLLFSKEAQDLGFLMESDERHSKAQPSLEEPMPSIAASEGKLPDAVVPSRALRILAGVSYLLGWFTGLPTLFFLRKNRFVLFHSLQSVFLFGGVIVLYTVFVGIVLPISLDLVRLLASIFFLALNIVILVAWIVGMVTALMGSYYQLPVVGDFSEKIAVALTQQRQSGKSEKKKDSA